MLVKRILGYLVSLDWRKVLLLDLQSSWRNPNKWILIESNQTTMYLDGDLLFFQDKFFCPHVLCKQITYNIGLIEWKVKAS